MCQPAAGALPSCAHPCTCSCLASSGSLKPRAPDLRCAWILPVTQRFAAQRCTNCASASCLAAEKAEDGMLPYLMLPPLARKESPDPNQIDQTPHDKLTTAASADIAQVPIPALYLRILDRHNVFRARHGVANLTWDAGLAATARTWARGCKFAHNPASGVNFGENIHAAGLGSNADLPAAAMQATFNWWVTHWQLL
jgi:hypothetical protein